MPWNTQEKVAPGLLDGPDHMATYAETAVHGLNHRVRPCLNGRTSCEVFFESGKRPAFTKRGRRGVYDWVMESVERILLVMNQSGHAVSESAWRIAVESWLWSQGHIRIHIKPSVTPFYLFSIVHKYFLLTMHILMTKMEV
jgi:hypothetical protein